MKAFLIGVMIGVYAVPVALFAKAHVQAKRDKADFYHEDLMNHIGRVVVAVKDSRPEYDFRGAL